MQKKPANKRYHIVKIRRDYNTWVANETLEDYALRFTPHAFRKWSEGRIANTALGAASFLVLEAIGGAITLNYGFINAFWAILFVGLIIFLAGLPISYYAAKYGVDMDLLTRGAGFGYIGSTITSFVYASFTFILFALEAAIMAYALELYFGLPLYLGYLLSALAVIPFVTHGVTLISRIQMFTQPIWLMLMIVPLYMILYREPHVLHELMGFAGKSGSNQFQWGLFGAATAAGVALITQIGEQVDYLRFMPRLTAKNRVRWHLAVLLAGPGWVLLGIVKMVAGGLLAYLAVRAGFSWIDAANPTLMYRLGFTYVFQDGALVLVATLIFVVVSQVKINMTNAYAGSLAWSNFFARLTHSHPGRVVWVVFNALIAVMLMEFNVFQALEQVLGLYSNIALSWIAAVVADLVINKPMGWSPKGIEFKRAHLYDINPVGVGAMLLASVLSTTVFLGGFGTTLQPFSVFIAILVAFVTSPLIAWKTEGKYYLARTASVSEPVKSTRVCAVCEREYEHEDMAYCPVYSGDICSLCCTLDVRCDDACKPRKARLTVQWGNFVRRLMPRRLWRYIDSGVGHYVFLMLIFSVLLGGLLGVVYYHEQLNSTSTAWLLDIKRMFIKLYAALIFLAGVVVWWLVLASQSRRVAQVESNRQTGLLTREIALHKVTDAHLQQARQQAEQANKAKTRYITTISHELRTPLNSILGYAQILDQDASIPAHRKQAVSVIQRSGDHLLSLIEKTLDIARIESGKLKLDSKPFNFKELIEQIVYMFEVQARARGLGFSYLAVGDTPIVVKGDARRIRQILINILGNAIKFTEQGDVNLRLIYAREMALFEITDTGPGIPLEVQQHLFEPFASASSGATNTGLGLGISKMLTELMGGEIGVTSQLGAGTSVKIKLFMPEALARQDGAMRFVAGAKRIDYIGVRKRILLVDNEDADRIWLSELLKTMGFEVIDVISGMACLNILSQQQVDVILMDLAMPGIDGWETIKRINEGQLTDSPIAIVSANAFDKSNDNPAGLAVDDFILKPVCIDELLDWLTVRLGLEWVVAPLPSKPALIPRVELIYPPVAICEDLKELITLGYVRGIGRKLEEIAHLDLVYMDFVKYMQALLTAFDFDAMQRLLSEEK
jgi:signal transduction histidine kinase/purine-cytosine permease-like protein/ActR/RegA family two-component response regulator